MSPTSSPLLSSPSYFLLLIQRLAPLTPHSGTTCPRESFTFTFTKRGGGGEGRYLGGAEPGRWQELRTIKIAICKFPEARNLFFVLQWWFVLWGEQGLGGVWVARIMGKRGNCRRGSCSGTSGSCCSCATCDRTRIPPPTCVEHM